MYRSIGFATVLALGLESCSSPVQVPQGVEETVVTEVTPKMPLHGQPQPEVWFDGTTAKAFSKAQAENKLVFLYWGAVWCPPCNELKANVFAQPQFAELMQPFVPVYLDGDTEQAQIWGEKLQISGYPTVLVLDPTQKEIFRLNSSVSLEEFAQVLQPLLGQSRNFASAVHHLEQKTAEADDWRVLAYTDWEQLPAATWQPARRLAILARAVAMIPASLQRERALLASQLLSLAASESKAVSIKAWKPQVDTYLGWIQGQVAAVSGARSFINNQTASIAKWLYPKDRGIGYQNFKKAWLSAAAVIAQNSGASIDTRLWAVYPEIELARFERGEGPLAPALQQKVQEAVRVADQRAQNPYERHAVISGAAYLLRQVQDFEGARQLLVAEAARTDTPWYYYSSLAALEQEQKNGAAAQQWAAKARQSVQGRASKIQWIASDIMLNAKLPSREQHAYLLTLAREYYELATQLSDGFAGRNRARAEKVKESLQGFRQDREFASLFKQYRQRCEQLPKDNEKNCQDHFQGLL